MKMQASLRQVFNLCSICQENSCSKLPLPPIEEVGEGKLQVVGMHQHHPQCDIMDQEIVREKRRDSNHSKVSIRLSQNILIDNIQDVSKTSVNSDQY